MGICIRLSDSNSLIGDNFARPPSDVQKEIHMQFSQIWHAICDKFAQRSFANAAFSKFLISRVLQEYLFIIFAKHQYQTLAILISHRKSPPNHQHGAPKMNFFEFSEPAFTVEHSSETSSRHLLGAWGNEVDMLGNADFFKSAVKSPFQS